MAPKETMCEICGSQIKGNLRVSPQSCRRRHTDTERACGQCWEAHISTEVEEKAPNQIECMFCDSILTEAEILKLARRPTGERYV